MPRYNVQHPTTKKWRCFSDMIADWVTDWMDEKRYQEWRKREYGRQAGEIREANQLSLEEAERVIMERKQWEDECVSAEKMHDGNVPETNVGDTVSRQAAIDCFWSKERYFRDALDVIKDIRRLPSAQPEIIRCKDCKYFEIVAHEVCMKWGNGCQTSADGWCFMAERKTDETD